MNRLERLYAINEAIRRRAPRPVSAARLAEEFAVSRRTIERDLAALRAAGVPLYAESGRSGGQRSVETPDKIVLALSVPEISALLIALRAGGADLPFADDGQVAAMRLLDSLPDVTRLGVEELRSRIRTQVDRSGSVGVRTRRTLEQAVVRSVRVNIEYLDATGNHTKRSVEPQGFYQGSDGWYLIGWCQLRDAGRIFRLDRISSARRTTSPISDRDLDDTLGWTPHEVTAP
ncbi:MAG: WYL domain-containing protein [Actinobacteria bacterium]|nr:WYL domain-containing protein [Actinomycetota bacterium]